MVSSCDNFVGVHPDNASYTSGWLGFIVGSAIGGAFFLGISFIPGLPLSPFSLGLVFKILGGVSLGLGGVTALVLFGRAQYLKCKGNSHLSETAARIESARSDLKPL